MWYPFDPCVADYQVVRARIQVARLILNILHDFIIPSFPRYEVHIVMQEFYTSSERPSKVYIGCL